MGVLNNFSLKGKTGIVTGGAGIYGRSIVEGLCEAGAGIIIASRDIEKSKKFAKEYKKKKYKIYPYQLDLSVNNSILNFTAEIAKDFKKLDFLVNNSVLRSMWRLDDDIAKWEQSMAVNATGTFSLTREVANLMIRRKVKGSILNIASIQGIVGPDLSLYEGTPMEGILPPDYFFHKAGLVNLTKYFAAQYGKYGIRVNSIAPGGFFNNQDKTFVTRYCKRTFLNRMADINDIKGAIVFLVSDASGYVTGTNLMVDGGYTAK
ncbi:MAG: SDR family oxidoreductase [Elusimicrobiota bacterium]